MLDTFAMLLDAQPLGPPAKGYAVIDIETTGLFANSSHPGASGGRTSRVGIRRLTESGHVLFATMGTVRAVVDYMRGRIPAKGVWVHHLDTRRFAPAFVAVSLSARWNDVHQRGTSITRSVVNDLEIPVLPLHQHRRVAVEPSRLGESARRARALTDEAERAAAAVLDVVFGGAPDHHD